MGTLLKPKPTTRAGAKLRYEAALTRAKGQYDRAVAEIEARERAAAENQFVELSQRTLNCLINEGLVPFSYRDSKRPRTDMADPQKIADAGATQLLKIPNFGHKCFAEIDVWLRHNGFELQP